jgi:small subunit ribosomal protein S18
MARATNPERKQKKRRPEPQRMRKKVCFFCQEGIDVIDWKEVGLLRKYMSDRAKIRSRRVNGNCPRHQRQVSIAIKRAREMALLSYTGRS